MDTGNLIVLFGEDFEYENALYNYYNLDNLIKAVDEYQNQTNDLYKGAIGPTKFKLRYSTPSEYIESLKNYQTKNKMTFPGWPLRSADLFPYADKAFAYWTGYFSTRANLKKTIRDLNVNMMSSSFLAMLSKIDREEKSKINSKLILDINTA